mgnify:FL=1
MRDGFIEIEGYVVDVSGSSLVLPSNRKFELLDPLFFELVAAEACRVVSRFVAAGDNLLKLVSNVEIRVGDDCG